MKAPRALLTRAAPMAVVDSSDGFTLEGLAAVFDTPTRIDSWEGTFDEQLAPGAFTKTLQQRSPVLQWDHGRDPATGSVPIGAIEALAETDAGLFVRARLHDNARVEPIRQAISSGAIDGMSFRFRVLRDDWDESRADEPPLRTIRELELFEVGPVAFPAYSATSVSVRSMLADLTDDDRMRFVRDLAVDLGVTTQPLRGTSDDTEPTQPEEGTSETPRHTRTVNQRRALVARTLRTTR